MKLQEAARLVLVELSGDHVHNVHGKGRFAEGADYETGSCSKCEALQALQDALGEEGA